MILFLDISSTCTGIVVASKEGKITHHLVTAMWYKKDEPMQEKCRRIYRMVINLNEEYNFEKIVFEMYSANMKRSNGMLVCPMLQGAVLAATGKLELPYDEITPQTWRKNCGIKKRKELGQSLQWKIPTKEYFDKKMEVPQKIESNITGKMRTCPYDVYDALGICEGYYGR